MRARKHLDRLLAPLRAAPLGAERGSITPAMAIFGVAIIFAAGLAIDGGRKLNGLAEARDLADNAARVGAQHVDPDGYRNAGSPMLDPVAAEQAARNYLATASSGVTVDSIIVSSDAVTVSVTLRVDTRILPGPMTVSATELATAEASVTGDP